MPNANLLQVEEPGTKPYRSRDCVQCGRSTRGIPSGNSGEFLCYSCAPRVFTPAPQGPEDFAVREWDIREKSAEARLIKEMFERHGALYVDLRSGMFYPTDYLWYKNQTKPREEVK